MAGLNGGQGGSKFHPCTMDKPDSRQKRFVPAPPWERAGGTCMQTKRIYQVQHWPDGEWDRGHNWKKNRSGQRKRGCRKGLWFLTDCNGPPCPASRAGAQVRRSQAAQRDRFLRSRIKFLRSRVNLLS